MGIPRDIRKRVSKTLEKIETGVFHQNDFEFVLISLRDYSPKESLFKEIAHFVSHHKRDKGHTHSLHYKAYCIINGFIKYRKESKIDISKPLDPWEYDFIIHQLKDLPRFRICIFVGISRGKAIQIVEESILRKEGKYYFEIDRIADLEPILNVALSLLRAPKPLCDSRLVIENFIETVLGLGFSFNKEIGLQISDKLLLAIMVVMNNRNFVYKKEKIGHSKIIMGLDKSQKLGTLNLQGIVNMRNGARLVIPIIETNIGRGELISEDLIIAKYMKSYKKEVDVFDTEADLTLINVDGSMKLGRL